jgi:hypothetical protein
MLFAEFKPTRPPPKFAPQHNLRQTHFTPQFAREFDGGRGATDHRCPTTMLRMVPLPVPGRIWVAMRRDWIIFLA